MKSFHRPPSTDTIMPFSSISLFGIRKKAQRNKNALIRSIEGVIESGIFLGGQKNREFTNNLNHYLGGGYVLPVASGHDALLLAIKSLGLTKNDEVLFPVNAYPTAFPIALSEATPVPVDVEENGQLDIGDLRQKYTKNSKVLLVVHLYGLMTDMRAIGQFIRSHRLFLIEDAAQAFGSRFDGRLAGTFGDISCFSFYPTKNLGGLGDGGAIWTKHKRLYGFVRQAAAYGESERYKSRFISGHSRLPEIQAGALSLYLKDFNRERAKRKIIYAYYRIAFTRRKLSGHVRIFSAHALCDPTIHLFVVAVQKRDALRSYLEKRGIETRIHYPHPVHRTPAFRFFNHKKGTFPQAEKLASKIVSLPFHPYLTKREINYIVDAVASFYKRL